MTRTNNEPVIKPIVTLIGHNGEVSAIIEKVCRVLIDAGHHDQVERYMQEAMSGNRHHLLQVTMKYCEVE